MISPFKLERYFDQHEFSTPHMLSASDCETLSVGELLERAGVAVSEFTSLPLGYTQTQGDPALRSAIAALYKDVTPDDVVVTNAPAEGIYLVMQTLLSPGDRVVVLTPCYQSLMELASHRGCDVVPWPLLEKNDGWSLDMDALPGLLADGTRLLVVNFPHNPTGFLPDRNTFASLLAVARAHGARVFSDEMYRGLEHEPDQRLDTAPDVDATAISLCGLSKTYGLPGLRIGWLVARDPDVRARLIGMKDYTTLCASGPGEFLARAALGIADELAGRSRERVAANLDLARALMRRREDVFSWRPPTAGPVAFVRLRAGSAQAFCDHVREAEGVLLVPSPLFEWGDSHVRMGLGRRAVPAAFAALDRALDTVMGASA